MDWTLAIERNTEALKRILAALVAMTGLAASGLPFSPCGRRCRGEAETDEGYQRGAKTLPRHLHRAVLRLLRPTESTVRRLIIVAARGIVMPPPPPRSARSSSPAAQGRIRSGTVATTWILPLLSPSKGWGRGTAAGGGGGAATVSGMVTRPLALPLFDRLPRWESRPRRPVPTSVPRISVPGFTTLSPIVPRRPPMPNDPVDATRLGRRLATLTAALDDLPRQAKRFARWRARRDAIIAQERNGDAAAQTGEPRRRSKPHRIWPLRPGRPPGQHPRRGRKKSRHEIHEILKDLHGLAFDVLEERRDTS